MITSPRLRFSRRLACLAAALATLPALEAGTIRYEFTGGSLVPVTEGLPAGVTVTPLSIGPGMGNLTDNGADPNGLRISGNDVGASTGTAITDSAYLSFSLTIPAGTSVDLLSMGLDHKATGAVNFSNSRVFSNIRGYASATNDTIGILGRTTTGSDASVVSGSISLSAPESNSGRGSSNNVRNGDFTALSNVTVTFYLPWIDGATATTSYTDIDNLTLTLNAPVPPPRVLSSAMLPETGLRIRFEGPAGQTYSLLACENLHQPLFQWEILSTGTFGALPTEFDDAAAKVMPRRFYVVVNGSRPAARIMPVGDSITEGASTFSVYRQPLWQKLTDAGRAFTYVGSRVTPASGNSLPHEGYSGQNAEYLASILPARFAANPADIVLIHSGHNHFDTDNPPIGPVPGIVAATESMIATCRARNPKVIILLAQVIRSNKLPKYSYIPALNTELAALAARLNTAAQPVILVDQATGFDPATDTIDDLVHPSASGATKMANRWFEALDPLFH